LYSTDSIVIFVQIARENELFWVVGLAICAIFSIYWLAFIFAWFLWHPKTSRLVSRIFVRWSMHDDFTWTKHPNCVTLLLIPHPNTIFLLVHVVLGNHWRARYSNISFSETKICFRGRMPLIIGIGHRVFRWSISRLQAGWQRVNLWVFC